MCYSVSKIDKIVFEDVKYVFFYILIASAKEQKKSKSFSCVKVEFGNSVIQIELNYFTKKKKIYL